MFVSASTDVDRATHGLPSRRQIAAHWNDKLRDGENVGDGSECFACGDGRWLERAHILAASRGGSNTVDNLHVLCVRCHLDSEMLEGDVYWRWFASRRKHWMPDFEHTLRRLAEIGLTPAVVQDILTNNDPDAAGAELACRGCPGTPAQLADAIRAALSTSTTTPD